MKNFQLIIFRYIRFFISSMVGSFLLIIKPILILSKIYKKSLISKFLLVLFVTIGLFLILFKMLGF